MQKINNRINLHSAEELELDEQDDQSTYRAGPNHTKQKP